MVHFHIALMITANPILQIIRYTIIEIKFREASLRDFLTTKSDVLLSRINPIVNPKQAKLYIFVYQYDLLHLLDINCLILKILDDQTCRDA
jgi:hypothetical protein